MEQILQSLNLGTLRGRFEAQRIEPQAVGKSFDKIFFPNFFFKIFS